MHNMWRSCEQLVDIAFELIALSKELQQKFCDQPGLITYILGTSFSSCCLQLLAFWNFSFLTGLELT